MCSSDLFAYYPAWLGQTAFFGPVLVRTPLAPAFHSRRLIGGGDMQLIAARWDGAHSAEQPIIVEPGWQVVDRLDVADIASEDAHAWSGSLGRRRFADPTARWSLVHEEGTVMDGGRTIRGGSERFTIHVDPSRPVRLVMRTGGKPAYPFHDTIDTPGELVLSDAGDGRELARAALPAPTGAFVEVAFELRANRPSLAIVTRARSAYRVFHWFVVQRPME